MINSNDPAFLFYPGDYLRDTQCLSAPAQVSYDRIMCEHMRDICISKTRLNFFIKRLNEEQKSEILSILSKSEKGYQIPWVVRSVEKRRKYSDSRRKNRLSGKDKSSKKSAKHMKTYVRHMENENENINIKNSKNKESINKDLLKKKEYSLNKDLIEQKDQFNAARKIYPSTKRGNETEFKNFIKKHSDWPEVLPILMDSIKREIEHAQNAERNGRTYYWQNFQTWINQRSWEKELPEVKSTSLLEDF